MEYDALENMTVIKLREEAKKFPDVKGVSGMKKEELINVLVEKLGITVPERQPKKKKTPTVAKSKSQLKKMIGDLRVQQDSVRSGSDSKKQTNILRKRIHSLKRRLRKMT